MKADQFDQCMEQARRIVANYRAQAPAGCDPVNFSKPKAPEPNKKLEKLQEQSLQMQIDQAKKPVQMPSFQAPPVTPTPPPPTQSSSDVADAQDAARRAALARRGYQSTLFAGETGGYKGSQLGGNKTLLG